MKFTIEKINLNSFTINEGNRTVAYVTPQGFIDWLLISPDDKGELLTKIYKETHMEHTMGLKMLLQFPRLTRFYPKITHEILDNGTKVRLVGESTDANGHWKSNQEAILSLNPKTRRFEWAFTATLTCTASEAVEPPDKDFFAVEGEKRYWMEFNNIYPSKAGLCLLYERLKEYDHILMVDRDGTVWNFPHQHQFHTGRKIRALKFAEGTMAGWFGEKLNPIITIHTATLPPDWGICDMYYDLHCGARCPAPVAPGEVHRWTYTVSYIDEKEAEVYEKKVRAIPMTAEDYKTHHFPALRLGVNDFKDPVKIDAYDDASSFRTEPPVKVWDKQVGKKGSGSLRITNETAQETVWKAAPPLVIPPGTTLRLTALVKTQGVEGKGMFIRMCPGEFHWTEPHYTWDPPLESTPVNGTSDWVQVSTDVLLTPEAMRDKRMWIEVVLDGKGVAWLSDVDVDLQNVEADVPVTDPVLTGD